MEKLKRDPERFRASADSSSTSSVIGNETDAGIKRIKQERAVNETLNDFTLNLLQCGDVQSLGSVVKTGLSTAVADCYGGALFYQDENTGEVFTADNSDVYICSPKPQCISNVFTSGKTDYAEASSLPQCVLQHLPLASSSNTKTKVGCFPVSRSDGSKVLAVLVVVGSVIDSTTTARLPLVLQQIAACYNHIQRTFQSTRNVEERAGQQLIKLCGELYDQDAAQLQLKVLRYLEDQTQAECAFLYLVVPETQELFCQVIGKKILPEEERFSGQHSCFSVALETKQPMTLEDIPMESRKAIEEKIECPLRSFLCVPVTSRSNNNLIALTCVVNKQNANRFTDRDISCIHQCFRYTSTVLTSTLAFQNERKLKVQTQALLQVARDLFTNLGKCDMACCNEVDRFPFIQSRGIEVNLCGAFFLNSPKGLIHGARKCRYLHKGQLYPLYADYSMFDKLEAEAQELKADIVELTTKMKEVADSFSLGELEEEIGNQKETETLADLEADREHYDSKQNDVYGNEIDWSEISDETEVGFDHLTAKLNEFKTYEKSQEEENVIAHVEKLRQAFKTERKKFHQRIVSELNDTEGLCSPNNCASDSELSFATACSDNDEEDSHLTGRNLDDVFVDSLESFFIDDSGLSERDQNLEQYKQRVLRYLEKNVNNKDSEKPENEPVSISEQLPVPVTVWGDLNEAIHNESFDDTINNLSDYSADLSSFTDLKAICVDAINSDISSETITMESNIVENDTLSCEDEKNVNNKDSEKPENEPVSISEQLPVPVTVWGDLNEVFHNESFDDTINYLSDYSADLSSFTDLKAICVDAINSDISSETITKESNIVENDTLSCEDEKVSERAVKMVLISLSDAKISHIQAPEAVAGPITDNDLTKLLREIMQQARNLTHAERCSVFLIDRDTDELVAKVFDGITKNKDNEVQEEIRLPITQGIAGKVATSGELLNIRDAYSHPLFYRGIDDSTGFRTRNILCFPIQDEKGVVLGVAQLCNKQNCPCFTQFDEEIATAFGVYCCISISHSLMYKKVIDSQVRNTLANELMMYHMKSLMYKKLLESQHRKSLANELMIYHMQVSPDDVQGLGQVDIPHPRMLHPDFLQFSYAPRSLSEDKTLLGCLSMFEDLNILSRWRIRRETLGRFVLMVKKGYRNPPYHNWMHAYTVAQFCYQLIKNLKLENSLDDIEMFSLFVSCLCHDIDHRGTNNSFQTASSSVLAALYSSEESVLERHHFAQTMCILNTEGCNVFENLNSKDYQNVLDLMRDIILATDLAHHFKILKSLKELAERGFNKASVKDRKLLLCLLMTSCDLSDQTRPWDNTKRVAALIYKEFFSQGDMEKAKGLEPSDMMDRERAQIPALQIGFLEHVALPVYRLLGKLFPDADEVGERVEDNKQHWIKISNLIQLKRGGSQARMTFEEVLAIENETDSETAQLVNGSEVIGSKC